MDGAEDIANPHGRAPRNAVSSCLRVIYYFADHWVGWLVIVLPARIRSTLVIFDRDFLTTCWWTSGVTGSAARGR